MTEKKLNGASVIGLEPLAGWHIGLFGARNLMGRREGNMLIECLELVVNVTKKSTGEIQIIHEAFPILFFTGKRDFSCIGVPTIAIDDLHKLARQSLHRAVMNARGMLDMLRGAESGIQIARDLPKPLKS